MAKRNRRRNNNDNIIEVTSSSNESNEGSSSSSSSDDSSYDDASYNEIKKEVFIWVDSELKDTYVIDEKLTWTKQKEDIITKLLPPLYKLVNKRYDVSNGEILNMLYGRWRSRHRVYNIELQGEVQMKKNKRRAAKNTRMQDKKKRRTYAANYLIEANDRFIHKYPEKDLVQILKNSGYHSSEWEETDLEEEWPIVQEAVVEDDRIVKEAVKIRTSSLVIYKKWWRSPALRRLLHDRIDPTVNLLRKKEPKLKRKRVHQNVNNVSVPPIGTPSWCLNNEALEKFNRSTNDIPVYDDGDTGDTGDTDEEEIHDNSNHNTSENDDDNDSRRDNSSKKRKKNKHKKKSKKKRKEEKHKSKRK